MLLRWLIPLLLAAGCGGSSGDSASAPELTASGLTVSVASAAQRSGAVTDSIDSRRRQESIEIET